MYLNVYRLCFIINHCCPPPRNEMDRNLRNCGTKEENFKTLVIRGVNGNSINNFAKADEKVASFQVTDGIESRFKFYIVKLLMMVLIEKS